MPWATLLVMNSFSRGTPGLLDGDANFLLGSVHLSTVQMVEALRNGCFGQVNKTLVELGAANVLEPSCASAIGELQGLSGLLKLWLR